MKRLILLAGMLVSGLSFANNIAIPETQKGTEKPFTYEQPKNTKEFQKLPSNIWYWFTVCGHDVAFITSTYEEACAQAYEMWYYQCGPGAPPLQQYA
jgi:hypothetical protein